MKKGHINKYLISAFFALAVSVIIFLITWRIVESVIVLIIFYFGFLLNDTEENNEKVDKGFELLYGRLTNRRKFRREMWMLPFTIVVAALPWFASSFALWRKMSISLILLGVHVIGIFYSYIKWKRGTGVNNEAVRHDY